MNTGLLLLIITVAVALAFDFLNGFHDEGTAAEGGCKGAERPLGKKHGRERS